MGGSTRNRMREAFCLAAGPLALRPGGARAAKSLRPLATPQSSHLTPTTHITPADRGTTDRRMTVVSPGLRLQGGWIRKYINKTGELGGEGGQLLAFLMQPHGQ